MRGVNNSQGRLACANGTGATRAVEERSAGTDSAHQPDNGGQVRVHRELRQVQVQESRIPRSEKPLRRVPGEDHQCKGGR